MAIKIPQSVRINAGDEQAATPHRDHFAEAERNRSEAYAKAGELRRLVMNMAQVFGPAGVAVLEQLVDQLGDRWSDAWLELRQALGEETDEHLATRRRAAAITDRLDIVDALLRHALGEELARAARQGRAPRAWAVEAEQITPFAEDPF